LRPLGFVWGFEWEGKERLWGVRNMGENGESFIFSEIVAF